MLSLGQLMQRSWITLDCPGCGSENDRQLHQVTCAEKTLCRGCHITIQLVDSDGSTFTSPVEENMNPGDHIVFTLGFNEAIPGPAQTVTVVADPNDQIDESSKGNNTAAAAMTITATGN